MRPRRRLLLLALLVLLGGLLGYRWMKRAKGPKRVPARLAFPRSGAGGLPLRAVPAFPGLRFQRPLFLCAAPGDDAHVYVAEQAGRILRVAPDGRADVFLDITSRVLSEDTEEGLLGVAFDPDFATSRALYVYSSRAAPRRVAITRFRVPPGGAAADPASEEIVLEIAQPYGNHNGGMIAFGPDGFLYAGVGDGGSAGDPHGHGQNLSTLLGTILRIDPRGGTPYAVPADNPFADGRDGARGEIWAYGLRNPWRFSFAPDGRLWAGDVGQNRREEIDVIVRGGNYGWNVFEGRERFGWRNAVASDDGMIPPVHDYPHDPIASVTGGYVYRGSALPAYQGLYFFGDFVTGEVWTLAGGEGGATVRPVAVVPALSSFGEDARGELYALSHGGTVYRFRERAEDGEAPPERLSETGLFLDTKGLIPARGLLGYRVRHPAWHDGATATRWMALPAEGRIAYDAHGSWTFPPGAAFVMHLERDGRRLETRVLFRDDDGWAAYSYRWNAEQTDALRGGERVEEGDWLFPGTADCLACHNEPAGRVLGVRANQLDAPGDDGRPLHGVIDAWNAMGLFDNDVSRRPAPDALARREESAPADLRARAYLEVNCASCHRSGGLTPSNMDLRHGIALDAMRIAMAPPRQPLATGDLARVLLAPGNPDGSQIVQRLRADPPLRMPPLAKRPDPLADEILRAWILGMAR